MQTIPRLAALAILLAQVVTMVYARFTPARYFCWAPYDMQTDYRLEVAIGGHELTPAEIRQRYRRPAQGADNRSVQNLIDILEGVERNAAQKASIVMTYRINGKEERTWRHR
jgi:hypothetical protein